MVLDHYSFGFGANVTISSDGIVFWARKPFIINRKRSPLKMDLLVGQNYRVVRPQLLSYQKIGTTTDESSLTVNKSIKPKILDCCKQNTVKIPVNPKEFPQPWHSGRYSRTTLCVSYLTVASAESRTNWPATTYVAALGNLALLK